MANKNKGANTKSTPKMRGGGPIQPRQNVNAGRLTPEEWEAETGNKLLSYSTDSSGRLLGGKSYMSMSDWEKQQAAQQSTADESAARSSGLLKSAYEQVMGRAAGGTQGLFQGDSQTLGRGGFYGSMPELEAASMRLADAALKREMLGAEYKGTLETGLQQLKGSQATGLQQLIGSQETELAKFRADQEAKSLGYTSSDAMARDIASRREEENRRRREEEYAQKMRSQGYQKVGSRWLRTYAA